MTALDRVRPVAERAERWYLRRREAARVEQDSPPAEGRADFFLLGMLVGVTFVAEVLGHVQRARELDDREARAQLILVGLGDRAPDRPIVRAADIDLTRLDPSRRPAWHESAGVDEGQAGEPEPVSGPEPEPEAT